MNFCPLRPRLFGLAPPVVLAPVAVDGLAPAALHASAATPAPAAAVAPTYVRSCSLLRSS